MGGKIGVDAFAERIERGPGVIGERRGDARLLGDALDAHVEEEGDGRRLDQAGDRRGRAVMRRRRDRHVAFGAQQSRGRVEADPAGAGKIDFGPGVQVGEVLRGAGRTVERFHVGLELDEIAGNETRGQADVAENLHQQPRRVAAGAGGR